MTNAEAFSYPMRCRWCDRIHDAAKVTPTGRYSDCTTWRCPNCDALIDDRPAGWGGSAFPVSQEELIWEQRGVAYRY